MNKLIIFVLNSIYIYNLILKNINIYFFSILIISAKIFK